MQFEKYYYGSRELVMFLDEAGDGVLGDPENPMFVIGGCACFGTDLNAEIRTPWLDVREAVLRNRDSPIHMRELRTFGKRREAAMSSFFDKSTFKRVAMRITNATLLEGFDGLPRPPIVELAFQTMLKSSEQLMPTDTPTEAISLIFEDGPFVDRFRKSWARQKLTRSDGVMIPVSWAVLPKGAGEPGLEVADYIVHTACGFARTKDEPSSKFAARNAAVFPPNSPHARNWELNHVEFKPRTAGQATE